MEKALLKFLKPYTSKLMDSGGNIYRFISVKGESEETITVYIGGVFHNQKETIEIAVDEVNPCDIVPFITPRYEKLFTVKNLDFVYFDGNPYRVIASDTSDDSLVYHFSLYSELENRYVLRDYHICQFAERINENGKRISPHGE